MVTVLIRCDIIVTGTDNIHYNTYTNDTLIMQKISLRYLNTPVDIYFLLADYSAFTRRWRRRWIIVCFMKWRGMTRYLATVSLVNSTSLMSPKLGLRNALTTSGSF